MIRIQVLASLIGFSAAALGAPITWNVNAVVDLATPRGEMLDTALLGSFVYDADTATASSWNFILGEGILRLHGPTPCVGPWPYACDVFTASDNTYTFTHIAPMSGGTGGIRLVTRAPLSDNGGFIPLVAGGAGVSGGSVSWIFGGAAFSGPITEGIVFVPEPSTMGITLVGTLALGIMARRTFHPRSYSRKKTSTLLP